MGLPINFESCFALSDACGLSSEPKCREVKSNRAMLDS